MKKNKNTIDMLKYGELHFYYPIQFKTSISFTELCKNVENSTSLFNDKYQQEIENALTYQMQEAITNFSSTDFGMTATLKSINPITGETEDLTKITPPKTSIHEDNLQIKVGCNESSLYVSLESGELEALKLRIQRLETEEEQSRTHYGSSYISKQKRYLLLPFHATLNNGKKVWIHALLFMFSNNMGVLKLELPLIDIDITPLKQYNPDSLIKSISNTWKKEETAPTKLSDLCSYYLNTIITDKSYYIIKFDNELKNIILLDFNSIPKQIGCIPLELKEELFRIICAPVPQVPYSSYQAKATDYLKTHNLTTDGIMYIAKSTGGLLTLVDSQVLNYFSDNFKTQLNTPVLSSDDYYDMCNHLVISLNNNVEFALLVILLKKLNESNDLHNKQVINKEFYAARKEYNQNTIFINKLHQNCFGSVLEQTSALINMMPHYLNQELTISTQTALNSLISDHKQQQSNSFLNFISIGGLLLALILGLPSLHQTLSILHNSLSRLWETDIPYISIDNTSIFIWLVLVIIIIYQSFCKK